MRVGAGGGLGGGGGVGLGGGKNVCQAGNVDAVTAETKLIEAANIYWNGVDVRIYDTLDGEDEEKKIFRIIPSKMINLLIVCVSVVGRAPASRHERDHVIDHQ